MFLNINIMLYLINKFRIGYRKVKNKYLIKVNFICLLLLILLIIIIFTLNTEINNNS